MYNEDLHNYWDVTKGGSGMAGVSEEGAHSSVKCYGKRIFGRRTRNWKGPCSSAVCGVRRWTGCVSRCGHSSVHHSVVMLLGGGCIFAIVASVVKQSVCKHVSLYVPTAVAMNIALSCDISHRVVRYIPPNVSEGREDSIFIVEEDFPALGSHPRSRNFQKRINTCKACKLL